MIKYIRRKLQRLSYLMRAVNEQSVEMGEVWKELSYIRKAFPQVEGCSLPLDYSWQKMKLYAHAMGAVDGIVYTNSRDAFIQNYEKGCRVFETDISLTEENIPVLCHDWRQIEGDCFVPYEKALKKGNDHIIPMKYADFMFVRLAGHYAPMDLNTLVELANQYTDAYFIISVKSACYVYDETVRMRLMMLEMLCKRADENIWLRMIPQVHSPVYYYKLMSDFHFNSVIYGMRFIQIPLEDLTAFLKKTGIKAVACDHGKDFTNKTTFDAIHAAGADVIVATVNDSEEYKKWKKLGADAFLTDFGFLNEEWHNNERTL